MAEASYSPLIRLGYRSWMASETNRGFGNLSLRCYGIAGGADKLVGVTSRFSCRRDRGRASPTCRLPSRRTFPREFGNPALRSPPLTVSLSKFTAWRWPGQEQAMARLVSHPSAGHSIHLNSPLPGWRADLLQHFSTGLYLSLPSRSFVAFPLYAIHRDVRAALPWWAANGIDRVNALCNRYDGWPCACGPLQAYARHRRPIYSSRTPTHRLRKRRDIAKLALTSRLKTCTGPTRLAGAAREGAPLDQSPLSRPPSCFCLAGLQGNQNKGGRDGCPHADFIETHMRMPAAKGFKPRAASTAATAEHAHASDRVPRRLRGTARTLCRACP